MTTPEESLNILDVRLGHVHVGTITLKSEELSEFVFSDKYFQVYPRPVLGQFFEDNLSRRHTSRMRLPPFFSNLLPEGSLRQLVARQIGVHEEREFFLLARLGEDLPGALVITPRGRLDWSTPFSPAEATEADATQEPHQLRFSLAGIQLKFSMLRTGRGMTLPASGRGGDWIVKLPDNRFEHVPLNEYSMMTWARAAGLQVPEILLVQVADLEGLPEGLGLREEVAFAVRRFDRPEPGRRVHMEDLAQVYGLYAAEKYKKTNYETIARVMLNNAGRQSFLEFLRRLVFNVAIGNGDAHNKNWTLLYPDGVKPELSPAYDLVSTFLYIPTDTLALNLARSKRFEDVSLASFKRLARKLELDSSEVLPTVQQAVEATLQSWSQVRSDLPLPEDFKRRIEEHWKRVPLLQGR